ncbi:unnamed protein product [Notodromas monacha]|uniref:Tudor domain-containing protein n=1 Tax=Notodromas monacha TaxID=399045 RepID=A0A7R9BN40_9CRUS|nr:unnamed protein product [Notodromas monacha]CAG0917684.1 unnamed protein product [Notodromas monacha]
MSKRSKAASSRETTPLNWGLLGFSVGTFVEVKNENEEWCPATVTVVQASAERVHVRYSDYPNKPDEWVQVPSDSVRFMSSDAIQKVTISEMKKCGREIQAFKQGDYVYAPWTNGSRHAAKILNVVENSDKDDPGKALYEVRFHDGFLLVVPGKRLRPLDPAIFHDEPVLRESRNVFTPESAIQDVEAHSGIRPKKLRMDLKEVFGRPRTSFADSSGSKKRGSGCQRTQPPETKISFPGPTARFSCAPPEASKSRKIAVKANARVTISSG